MARARLAATRDKSSPDPSPQLSDANGPSLTPPRRVKKPWPTPAALSRVRAVIMAPLWV